MSIIYNPNKRIFTLHTRNTTYQMMIDQYGYLLHLYYGTKNNGLMDYLIMYADRGFSGNPYVAGNDRTYSLDTCFLQALFGQNCKIFLDIVAKRFWTLLHVQIGQSCNAPAGCVINQP